MDIKTFINTDRLVNRFIELVRIDSLSGEEERISLHLASEFEKLGCSVIRDEAGNVVAHFPANGKEGTVMFCAHMDTVGEDYGIKPIIEDGIIHTDGSTILGADDKSGLAVMFEMLEILREHPEIRHPELEMVSTISEEKGLVGSKKLDKSLLHADWGVILDRGGTPGTVSISGPTNIQMCFTFHGKTAHAASEPERGINAIKAAALGIVKAPCGKVEEDVVIGIGIIQGGIATNVVPDEVTVRAMARSSDNERLEFWITALEEAMRSGAAETGASVTMERWENYAAYRLSDDFGPLKKMADACTACGIPLVKRMGLGGTDANIFNAAGIPCIPSASGDNGAHMKTESIAIEDMVQSVYLHLTAVIL